MKRIRHPEPIHRREAVAPADIPLVLAYALLVSLADDLALLRRAGFWKRDPQEMREAPQACRITKRVEGSFKCTLNSDWLLAELEGESTQTLYAVLAAQSQGRVQMGRGTVIRLARRESDKISPGRRAA